MRLRPATAADASEIAVTLNEAFDGYRAFAPRGWEPPPPDGMLANLGAALGRPGVWCAVAVPGDGSRQAGHVAFLPAADARMPDPDPGLAHFWMLFVRREFWGTGVAQRLHDAAVDEARRRGFAAMRLWVAEGQARARRFYERSGWLQSGEPYEDAPLGLSVVEYRRALSPDAAP
jgi:GNAT superfamily N-acetyltransferase